MLCECEALLIEVLGPGRFLKDVEEGRQIRVQNSMRFAAGVIRWEQLRTATSCPAASPARVDPAGFTDRWLRALAQTDGTA